MMKRKLKLPQKTNVFFKPPAIIAIVIVAVVGVYFLAFSKAATGPASITISPSSGSRTKDSTLPISVYLDSQGQDINAFTFKMSYDQAKFQPTSSSVDITGSEFSGCAEKSSSGGLVKLTCFVTGEVINTRQKVGTVTFKVLTGYGSSALQLGDDTQISQAGSGVNIWNGAKDLGSFTFTTPTPSTPTTPVTPTTPSTPKPTTGSGSATPSTSGTSGGSTGTRLPTSGSSNTNNGTSGSSVPTSTAPDPSSSQPQITGIVAVALTDANGKPATGVTVKIGSKEAITDANGVASFIGLAPGKYKLSARSSVLGAASKEITIGSEANQPLDVKLQLKKRPPFVLYGLVVLAVIALVIAVQLLRRKLRQRAEHNRRFAHMRGDTVSTSSHQPVNDAVATVVTPHSAPDEDALEKETLEKLKPKVDSTDTLEEIERKVGAKKAAPAPASSNDFDPNLIAPQKQAPHKTEQ